MNVTNMIQKIHKDYQNNELVVNSSIKYRFYYNGYQTDVFYTTSDGLQNQLLIVITIDDINYLTTVYFSRTTDGQYFMNYYLPPELYKNVQFTLLYVDRKCSTTPYFDEMKKAILNNLPIPTNHASDINGRHLHQYKEIEDNPFFETIIRKPMSLKMIKKIKNKYDYNVAQQILKYCGKTKTLRFTSDISRSKDILAYINKPS